MSGYYIYNKKPKLHYCKPPGALHRFFHGATEEGTQWKCTICWAMWELKYWSSPLAGSGSNWVLIRAGEKAE